MKTINLSALAGEDGDLVQAFREALAASAPGDALRLTLETGIYPLRQSRCRRFFAAISNHDSAERAIAFMLSGHDSIEFDGGGSLLLCEGRLIPFWVGNCRHVALRNFSIDWKRPFTSEAEIVDIADVDKVLLHLDKERFPYKIEDRRFVFTGPEGYESSYLKNALEFDPLREEVAPRARDTWGVREHYEVALENNGLIRLKAPFAVPPGAGNLLALPHEHRTSPAVVLSQSESIVVEDVTLHHAGGMGVIAQMCRDVTLRRVLVRPRKETGRMLSLAADASHFVECDGRILLEDCRFRGQLDDSANIHGVYLRVNCCLDAHSLVAEAVHFQQWHVDYLCPGIRLAFLAPGSFERKEAIVTVEKLDRLDPSRVRITLREPLPAAIDGHVLQVVSRAVDVEVRGCIFEKHRARGLLLSAPGRHWVHHNTFRVPGNGILATCDSKDWFEAGTMEELLVEDNVFDCCGYGNRPYPAAIRVSPAICEDEKEINSVQKNIRIRRNRFTGEAPAVLLHRCRNVEVCENAPTDMRLSQAVRMTASEAVLIEKEMIGPVN